MTKSSSTGRLSNVPVLPWELATRISTLFCTGGLAPETGVAGIDVAEHLRRQGALEQAETIYRQAIDALTAQHEVALEAATAYRGLARILESRLQYDEAAAFYEQAIDVLDRCRGTHKGVLPLIAKNVSGIACILKTQGKLDIAERLMRESLAALQGSSSAAEEQIVEAQCDLAALLQEKGMLSDAMRLYVAALRTQRVSLGWDHPNTRATRRRLKVILRKLDRPTRLSWIRRRFQELVSEPT